MVERRSPSNLLGELALLCYLIRPSGMKIYKFPESHVRADSPFSHTLKRYFHSASFFSTEKRIDKFSKSFFGIKTCVFGIYFRNYLTLGGYGTGPAGFTYVCKQGRRLNYRNFSGGQSTVRKTTTEKRIHTFGM